MKRAPLAAGLLDTRALHLRTGVATTSTETRVTVDLDGVSYTIPKLHGYHPRDGDRVQILTGGGVMLAIGAVGASGTLTTAPVAATAVTGFPAGLSVWSATQANGYPANGLLVVQAYTTAGRSTQRLTLASTGATATREFVRSWGAGPAWTPWIEVGQRPLFWEEDDTSQTAFTSATPAAGSPTVGGTFTPASDSVKVTVGGDVLADGVTIGAIAYLGWEIREGGTFGSGTLILGVDQIKRSLSTRAVAATSSLIGADRSYPALGLFTPGTTYNIRTMHAVVGGTATVRHRSILVEPI